MERIFKLLIGAAAAWLALGASALAQEYVVDPKKIVDGDNFYVSVRVVGADTPEIGHSAKCDKERAWGERASKRASELMRGTVTIQIKGVDKYDRLLARVILPDGRDLAQVLIAEKLAVPYQGGKKPRH